MRFHDALELSANVVSTRKMSEREEVFVAPLLGAVRIGCGLALESVVGVEESQMVTVRSCELAIVIETGEVVKLLKSSHHGLGSGRIHKIEVDKIFDTKLLELQDSVGKVGAQNLRVGLLDKLLLKSLFGIQTETFSRLGTTGTTSTLLGRSLGDGRDEERFDTDTGVVDLLFAETWIHDVHDTVDGQTGLSDVGGDDDLATGTSTLAQRRGSLVEDALLLMRRKSTVERVNSEGTRINFAR
ncbi:hypothetical protein HG530_012187 [Fusarium avenaceum]|nr:hypothetical protein HG530_012187 [Fusarium avenaceum]